MEALRDNEIYGQELLERITSFKVSEVDLMKDLEISEGTLRLYRKNKDKTPTRTSVVQMKLLVLENALELIQHLGFKGKEYEVFKELTYEGNSMIKFINQYASNPLAGRFVMNFIEKELGGHSRKKAIDSFRERYGYLNDENLLKASHERPDLLIQMVADTDLRPSTRGDILQLIAYGARPEFFDFVHSQLKSDSPFIREASLLSLFGYYQSKEKYVFLKAEFLNLLETESAEGVRKTLEDLIDEM
jgi:hypothetical protein